MLLNKKLFVSFILCFIFSIVLIEDVVDAMEIVELEDSIDMIPLDAYIEVLKETENEWTIEDVTSDEFSEEFELNQGSAPSYGYTSSIYWVRFQVDYQQVSEKWFLQLDNPTMDYFTLYMSDNEVDFEKMEMGDLYPFEHRKLNNRNLIYPLSFSSEGMYTFYLRFDSRGSMQLPLTLMNQDALMSDSTQDYIFLGMLGGIALAMALYNLFVYFSLRHRSYLYYVLFILINLFTFLSFSGLAYQFIWPEAIWWNNRSIVFFMIASNILALLFTNSFLEPSKFIRGMKAWFSFFILLNVMIFIIWIFSYPLALNLIVVMTGLSVIFIITVALITLRKGFRPARFFLLAWNVLVFGVMISILTDVGVIPFTFFSKYAWQMTTSAELILLSFALADKINTMRVEKEKAEKEAIESQQEVLANLKRTDKMKDEFLAVTSHELRTPLNGIIGIAESMHDGAAGKLNDPVKENLSMIIVSGKRLAHLINEIVDFSKLNNRDMDLSLKEVDVKEVVDMVVNICRPLLKNKPITLENELQNPLPSGLADENRFQQILYNLIGNAIKYTEAGRVVIRADVEEDFIKIEVADTGIGIPEDKLESIFLPFVRVDKEEDGYVEGMGIGLNISKRFVELQGGKMTVVSEEGAGSVFSFTIPRYKYDEKKTGESLPTKPIALEAPLLSVEQKERAIENNNGKKILVADDEPINLQILINYLTLEGYQVVTASSGQEAIDSLEKDPSFDLVILDIMMPKVSGYKVCHEIRRTYSFSELPVLMLTAKNNIEDRLAAFEAGANDYLVKPCDKRELLARTKTYIHLSEAVRETKARARQLNTMNVKLKEMNDILEEKVIERTKELAEKNVQLNKKNDKLVNLEESRIQLLSNISHELGTPITFLQGYVQTVKEGFIDANNPKYLDLVENKVKLLDRLIHDLFDLVKFESGKMSMKIENVEIRSWLSQVHEKFVFDIGTESIFFPEPLITNLDKGKEGILSIDFERMDQVFTNLFHNAMKHTSKNGKIELFASVCFNNEDDSLIEFDGKVLIEVRDNGSGIDEHSLPYVFDRFFKESSNDNDRSGTGLGLAITREIVEYHKGEIWVESEKGIFTSFFITLPIILIDKSN
ncbi:ATP-binding protein [Salipaludibacillus daqingensis]|uniref:ATP-binding protein n=1 Tax=Salipaludibacillus daqingensis TaxID=3041001 RepID=UPI002476CB93|nr:ATP-binding protein [Salipaludibacillus daqingensis]